MKMKIPFSYFVDAVGADVQAVIECSIEWERGDPKLNVDDVLDITGKASLLFDFEDEPYLTAIGYRIADAAEKCPVLLDRAKARDCDEREAA